MNPTTTAAAEVDTLEIAERVAARVAQTRMAATIVRLGGVKWGWFGSPAEPRMNLRTVDVQHYGLKVWLESEHGGRRVFHPDGDVPSVILDPLRAWLETPGNRPCQDELREHWGLEGDRGAPRLVCVGQ